MPVVSLGPRQRASVLLSSPDQIFARFDGFTGPDAVVNQGIGSRDPLSSFLVPSLMLAKLRVSPLRFRFAFDREGEQDSTRWKIVGGLFEEKKREMVGWKFGGGEGRGRRVAMIRSVGRLREGEEEEEEGKISRAICFHAFRAASYPQVGVRVVFEGRSFRRNHRVGSHWRADEWR